jgi:hypothetical protein
LSLTRALYLPSLYDFTQSRPCIKFGLLAQTHYTPFLYDKGYPWRTKHRLQGRKPFSATFLTLSCFSTFFMFISAHSPIPSSLLSLACEGTERKGRTLRYVVPCIATGYFPFLTMGLFLCCCGRDASLSSCFSRLGLRHGELGYS